MRKLNFLIVVLTIIVNNSLSQSFTVVVFPDTQNIIDEPDLFYGQVQWVIDNAIDSNIVFVSHEGDITATNTIAEWQRADTAYSMFESNNIPYGILPGNHDRTDMDYSRFNTYFGASRFEGQSYYGGHYGSDNYYNYQLFSAAGMDFIIIHLRYAPIAEAIAWADNIIESHSDRRAILVCHNLAYYDSVSDTAVFDTWGQNVYNAVKDNKNLFMMLNGHYWNPIGWARRADIYNGNTVHTILANYQAGGGDKIRLLKFVPEIDSIYISTYSPSHNTFLSNPENEFAIFYDMESSYSISNPTLLSAFIENDDPSVLRMAFSQLLANIAPATIAFSVNVNQIPQVISKVDIHDAEVHLHLSSPVLQGDVVTVSYIRPETNPLQSISGDFISSIEDQTVINNCIENNPPNIQIFSPTKSTTYTAPADIAIEVIASDIDGQIIKVEYFNNTTKLGETMTMPHIFIWKAVAEGQYSIIAKATDNKGTVSTSETVSVLVTKSSITENQVPIIFINAPNIDFRPKKNDNVFFEIEAYDPDGIVTNVKIKSGNKTLVELHEEPYTYLWEKIELGTYYIGAVAEDDKGALAYSQILELVVEDAEDLNVDMIELFPNPNNGIFSVVMRPDISTKDNVLIILNSAGSVLHKVKVNDGQQNIDISLTGLCPGIYILLLTNNEGILNTIRFAVI